IRLCPVSNCEPALARNRACVGARQHDKSRVIAAEWNQEARACLEPLLRNASPGWVNPAYRVGETRRDAAFDRLGEGRSKPRCAGGLYGLVELPDRAGKETARH